MFPLPLFFFRYLPWIRKDDKLKENLAQCLNQHEATLRSHAEFEEVYDEDKKALEQFRKLGDLGQFVVEDEDTATYTQTTMKTKTSSIRPAFKPRSSLGTSVSSIPSKVSGNGSLESIMEETEGASTPSPTKRRSVPSSTRTMESVSTLGTRESPKRRGRRLAVASVQSNRSDGSGDDLSDREEEDLSPAKSNRSSLGQTGESPSTRSKGTALGSDEESDADGSEALPSVHSKRSVPDSGESSGDESDEKVDSPPKRRKTKKTTQASPDQSEALTSMHDKSIATGADDSSIESATMGSHASASLPSVRSKRSKKSAAESHEEGSPASGASLPSIHSKLSKKSVADSSDDDDASAV